MDFIFVLQKKFFMRFIEYPGFIFYSSDSQQDPEIVQVIFDIPALTN